MSYLRRRIKEVQQQLDCRTTVFFLISLACVLTIIAVKPLSIYTMLLALALSLLAIVSLIVGLFLAIAGYKSSTILDIVCGVLFFIIFYFAKQYSGEFLSHFFPDINPFVLATAVAATIGFVRLAERYGDKLEERFHKNQRKQQSLQF